MDDVNGTVIYNVPISVQYGKNVPKFDMKEGADNVMARNTMNALSNALKSLMQNQKLDDISVQQLVDQANVNRKTFYYHFRGIGDLIDYIFESEFVSAVNIDEVLPDLWKDQFLLLLQYMRKESSFLHNVLRSSYSSEFRQTIRKQTDIILKNFIQSAVQIFEERTKKELLLTNQQYSYIEHYYSMAFLGLLEEWFQTGMKESNEHFLKILSQLSRNNMYLAFAHMSGIEYELIMKPGPVRYP